MQKIRFELLNIILIVGTFVVTLCLLPLYLIFYLSSGFVAFYLWKAVWYNLEKKQKLSDKKFILLTVLLSFFVIVSTLGTLVVGGDDLMRILYFSPGVLIPWIYLTMYFWKRYDLRLAASLKDVFDQKLQRFHLITLGFLFPFLISGSCMIPFVLYKLIILFTSILE